MEFRNRDQFLSDHNIVFEKKSDFLPPIVSYSAGECDLPKEIIEKLNQLKFFKPTPIQAVSIPIILEKNDFIGISKTGSGKTLAFLVPSLIYLSDIQTHQYQTYTPRMLVLAPTRELAIQTYEVFEKFGLYNSICCYGGSSRSLQYQELRRRKPPVIIGTPGRVNDFIEAGAINLEKCNYLVLDEADRMFDMGFYPQIKKIIDQCPSKENRQTLLFSATWIEKVQELAEPLLKPNRVLVSIGPLYSLNACSDIRQHLFLIQEFEKKKLLKTILHEFDGFKILVFCNTKVRCEIVSDICKDEGFRNINYIHGDVSQEKRERIIKDFNSGELKVIFATDVASRGLDIKNIHVVVNYDFPVDIETYVHRIGRCGRMGAKGLSFAFVTDRIFENGYMHKKLIKVVRDSGNKVPENLQA